MADEIKHLRAEVERLRADQVKCGQDYCALMDRHDNQHTEIDRLRAELASIRDVACGEAQVAEDDSEAMGWIYRRIVDALKPNGKDDTPK